MRVRDAAAALSVPRAPMVQRRLGALRRELRDGDSTPLVAARAVLEVVASEGLRRVDPARTPQPVALTPERVRLVCFQVVHS